MFRAEDRCHSFGERDASNPGLRDSQVRSRQRQADYDNVLSLGFEYHVVVAVPFQRTRHLYLHSVEVVLGETVEHSLARGGWGEVGVEEWKLLDCWFSMQAALSAGDHDILIMIVNAPWIIRFVTMFATTLMSKRCGCQLCVAHDP